jgi:hypothetical protein
LLPYEHNGKIKKIIGVTDLWAGFYLQVLKTPGTLKNWNQIDKRGGEMILTLGLTNYDPIKMMES